MVKKLGLCFVIAFVLAACSTPAPEVPTPYPTYTPQPTYTPYPTFTVVPTSTATPLPAETPIPPTPEPSPTAAPPEIIAKNVFMTQEQNGVEVNLVRLLITDPEKKEGGNLDEYGFEGSRSYVQPIFIITNNTDKQIKVSDYQGTLVSANGEQVSLGPFVPIFIRHSLSESILPGSTITAPVWVGIRMHHWNQISNVVVKLPYFESDGKKVTNDFIFKVDVQDWTFEPLPDILK